MSDQVVIAIVAGLTTAIPIIITQIAGIIISVLGRAKLDKKQDDAALKLDTIHTQTNSNLVAQKDELVAQRVEIKALNEKIQVLIQEKKPRESK